MKVPRIVLAGTSSSVGKTIIACGLIHGLRQQGYSVQPFKVGPDYIDPSYLSGISGNEACNLDAWLMGKAKVMESLVRNSNSNISVIEGVMGFYDGFAGGSNLASTHHIANITKSPVLLVLDAGRTSRSVAATALGFQRFHRNSRIAGIILNKLGSARHESLCRAALEQAGFAVLGAIHRDSELAFESRHLGLVPAMSDMQMQKLVAASNMVSDQLDMTRILQVIQAAPELPKSPKPRMKKPRVRICVALDNSFNFYYRDNLESLRREGATLEFFSPTRDRHIPQSDGIYIGGGFPEVLGGALERNTSMRREIRRLSEDGTPIYAECGGLMYLTRSIRHKTGRHNMAGVLDAETVMTGRAKLNYTRGMVISKNAMSGRTRAFHGHEFHYSELQEIGPDTRFAYRLGIGVGIAGGMDGIIQGNTLASYGHLYFDSTDCSGAFVRSCASHSRH